MNISLLSFSKFFLCLAVFCVVIVLPATFFPFIGGKYYFFRIAVELSLIFFVLWWAFEAPAGILRARVAYVFRQPIVLAVSAFALAFVLASLFADNPYGSFWSNYERGDGGFQMIHYFIFFALAALMFTYERDWRKMFWCFSVAAFLMILYGVLAAAYVSNLIGPYTFPSDVPTPPFLERLFAPNTRFQGSLGNPAYVAPYLMFAIFFALYLWLKEPRGRRRTVVSVVCVALLFLYLLFFILSQTRGTFFGLVVAVAVFLLYLLVSYPTGRKIAAVAFLIFMLLGGIAFSLRNSAVLKSVPGGRLLEFDFLQSTAQTRFWTWGSAWSAFLERPIFGWGPENFSTAFDKYFDPRHYVPGASSETWFDRAHSVIFDYLSETGILGLLAYLSIFVVFAVEFVRKVALRRFREGHAAAAVSQNSPVVQALILALPVGYLVQGLALFDVLPIYLGLFLFLAFMSYEFSPPART